MGEGKKRAWLVGWRGERGGELREKERNEGERKVRMEGGR